jgi:FKBP-type peptidyl-prolyl cis-trans isomerase FkpA/FKBP-type peptidyl-prolyl cis-trans isomerase FklB
MKGAALMRTLTSFFLVLFFSVSCQAADPKLETDEDRAFYSFGQSLGQQFTPLNLSEKELDLVKTGLTDSVMKRSPKADMSKFQAKFQEIARSRAMAVSDGEKKSGLAFLEKATKESGATKTASGLVIRPIKQGTGDLPKSTDTVKVHYTGSLIDGTVFDSSVTRGEPTTFPLDGVIPCWTEGVQQIKVGGKSQLVCPADIAYGDRGAPPKIKPGATLIFEVELLEIVKSGAASEPEPNSHRPGK